MKISVIMGDLTKVRADAIVNATNSGLLGGSGVNWAIHSAAGYGLMEECSEIRRTMYPDGLPTGQAVKTGGYLLPCRIIIHTVGPQCGKEPVNMLEGCYLNSLKIAEEEGCRTIAFPAISTGVYGCPISESVSIVKRVLTGYKAGSVEEVILVLFSESDLKVYKNVFYSNDQV